MKIRTGDRIRIRGSIDVGASKSISNRILLLKALYNGNFILGNISDSADTRYLQAALEGSDVHLFAGDGGTVARFLMVYAASQEQEMQIDGTARLRERPIAKLAEALQEAGVQISYLEKEGYLPLQIKGVAPKSGLTLRIDQPESSQFISALLMWLAGKGGVLQFRGELSYSYIQLSLNLLQMFYVGHEVGMDEEGWISISIGPGTPVFPEVFVVENDWSSACFWMGMLAQMEKGAEVELVGLQTDSLQPDAGMQEYFAMLGVKINDSEAGILLRKIADPDVQEMYFDLYNMPDAFPILACTCAAMGIKADFDGLQSLVFKESNRLESVADGLRKLGVEVAHNGVDQFSIIGGKVEKKGQKIDSFQDHRIAMAFASMVGVKGEIEILNPEVVDKSYPDFWKQMKEFVEGIEI